MSEFEDFLDIQPASSFMTPYEYQYWKGLKDKRRIVFPSNISSEDFTAEVLLPLKDMDDGSGKPIEIIIDCAGGDVGGMFVLIDILDNIKTPVHIHVIRYAMSAALLSLLGGKNNPNVHVTCSKHAVGLLHSGSVAIGYMNNDQAKDVMKFYSRYDQMIKELVIERTSIDAKLYAKLNKQETYMFGEEMLKYGFVDEIVGE